MANAEVIFSFGRNWLDFVNHSLDDRKMEIAYHFLLKYLPADEYGIQAAETVKQKFSSLIPEHARWNIFRGSILDDALVNSMKEKGDIVYSWGVLHHTGSMYEALKNAMTFVNPQGYLIIAIYNKAPYSGLWVKCKKIYNKSPRFLKLLYVYATVLLIYLERLLLSVKAAASGEQRPDCKGNDDYRGMSLFYNIIDWLGGFPYEYASFDEIKNFVENEGFELVKAPVKWPSPSKEEYKSSIRFLGRFFYSYVSSYTGTNEFIFGRTGRSREQNR